MRVSRPLHSAAMGKGGRGRGRGGARARRRGPIRLCSCGNWIWQWKFELYLRQTPPPSCKDCSRPLQLARPTFWDGHAGVVRDTEHREVSATSSRRSFTRTGNADTRAASPALPVVDHVVKVEAPEVRSTAASSDVAARAALPVVPDVNYGVMYDISEVSASAASSGGSPQAANCDSAASRADRRRRLELLFGSRDAERYAEQFESPSSRPVSPRRAAEGAVEGWVPPVPAKPVPKAALGYSARSGRERSRSRRRPTARTPLSEEELAFDLVRRVTEAVTKVVFRELLAEQQ